MLKERRKKKKTEIKDHVCVKLILKAHRISYIIWTDNSVLIEQFYALFYLQLTCTHIIIIVDSYVCWMQLCRSKRFLKSVYKDQVYCVQVNC